MSPARDVAFLEVFDADEGLRPSQKKPFPHATSLAGDIAEKFAPSIPQRGKKFV
jgi:hypothetical protein